MNNKNRSSLISARAGFLGGRFRARLRVYTLGAGEDASLYFSVHLWHAATQRQEQLSRSAAFAAR